MASFTDKISQFNPYIQQLPAQEMQQVGMYKQQQYDQGVQKIQGYIDNIAGMSIGRDVDKQHLQSSLNDLGSKLKTVAAGDFSNSQLVNSVGGMATSIVKDPIIQAAVSSVATDKRNTSLMDADQKKGELAEQDKWLYNKQRNEYYSNPNLTDDKGNPIQFNASYDKSVDADKIIMDGLKTVGDTKWTGEKIFVIDPDTGKPKHDIVTITDPKTKITHIVDRGPLLSEYTVKTIKDGKLPQNVMASIQSSLARPDVQKSLAVRGMYEYRGYTDANAFAGYLTNKIIDANKSTLGSLNAQKTELLQKLNSASNPDEKGSYEILAAQVDDQIKSLNNEATTAHGIYEKYGNNLDSLKAAVYQKEIVSNYMNQFTPSISETYEKSAPWEAQQSKIKQDFDMTAKRADIAIAQGNLLVAQGHLKLAEKLGESADRLAWLKFEKESKGQPPLPLLEPAPGTFGALGTFLQEGTKLNDDYDITKQKFVKDYFLALNHSQGKTDDKAILADFAKQAAADPTKFYNAQLAIAQADVTKNPKNTYYAGLVQQLPALEDVQRQVQLHSVKVDNLNNDPRVKSGEDDLKNLELRLGGNRTVSIEEPESFLQGINPFRSPSKKQFVVTSGDLLNLATAVNMPTGTDASKTKMVDNAKRAIEAKFGMPFEHVRQQFYGYGSSDSLGGPTLPTVDSNTSQALAAATEMVTSKKHMENISAKETVLREKMAENGPQGFEIYSPDSKPNEIKSVNERLKSVLATYANVNDMYDFNKAIAGTDADKEKYKIKVVYHPDEPITSAYSINLFDGSNLLKSAIIPKTYADYINGPINPQPKLSEVATMMKFGNGSSNPQNPDPTNPDAYKTAHYPSNVFSKLGRTDIVGADLKDYTNSGRPTLWFYQKDVNGNIIPIPFKESGNTFNFQNSDDGNRFINSLNSTLLNTILPAIK